MSSQPLGNVLESILAKALTKRKIQHTVLLPAGDATDVLLCSVLVYSYTQVFLSVPGLAQSTQDSEEGCL